MFVHHLFVLEKLKMLVDFENKDQNIKQVKHTIKRREQ